MKVAIVTDAWLPQVNGVVTVIQEVRKALEKSGHSVLIISPEDFAFTVPLPTYPEIRIPLFVKKKLWDTLDTFNPDFIHIPIESVLGFAARRYCLKNNLTFTTAFHTRYPDYVYARTGIPRKWTYAFLRWFHAKSDAVFVFSESLKQELAARGFKNLSVLRPAVDVEHFSQDEPMPLPGERPIFMYMGRLAIEKNVPAFLKLDLPGTKYVVGDGPERKELEKRFPDAVFTGYKFGRELARYLAAADVFVFPSLTDTLGMTMIEANACGVPVAALPSQASRAVLQNGVNGMVDDNLAAACMKALSLSRTDCRNAALKYGNAEEMANALLV